MDLNVLHVFISHTWILCSEKLIQFYLSYYLGNLCIDRKISGSILENKVQ
jgi:hypothetical protein